MRARIWWLSSVSCAFALLACNQILDNRKGVLQDTTETSPTHPAKTGDASATTPGGSSRAGAPDAATSDTADAASACPPELETRGKTCSGLCVSLEDPAYGCAAPDCTACNVPGAIPTCVGGACAVYSCAPGFADCNGDPIDGCEADLTSPASCGTCTNVCPSYPHTIATCSGTCLAECAPGWADCNRDPLDGCETNVADDAANCGQCGHGCFLGGCAQGQCILF